MKEENCQKGSRRTCRKKYLHVPKVPADTQTKFLHVTDEDFLSSVVNVREKVASGWIHNNKRHQVDKTNMK